ncbi:MAG: MFS domain-containing histidine kinase [Lysinibacillus sp.]
MLLAWNISDQLNHVFYESNVYVNADRDYERFSDEGERYKEAVEVDDGSGKSIAQQYAYSGKITIPKASVQMMGISQEYDKFQRNKYTFLLIWITGIVSAIFAWIWRKDVRNLFAEAHFRKFMLQWQLDLQVVVALFSAVLFWTLLWTAYNQIEHSYYVNYIAFVVEVLISVLIMLAVGVFFITQIIWLFGRVNTQEKWRENWHTSYMKKMAESLQDLFLNRSIALQSFVLIGAAFFGGGALVVALMAGYGGPVLLTFACIIVGIPSLLIFLARMGYLNRIMKDTEDMAAGRLHRDVNVRGKSPLAKHAENLNHLREGVRTSMHEQAKSERLKTELITNVSHDLRTPLTSIITYTDLLKNPNLTEEERQRYIHVLDKKSDRLKVLIEDLFEVSKMASGNIELHKSRVDLTQLIQQAVGEHKEDLIQANLDLRITMPSDPIYAYVDGQKWWRLIDNLVVNVLKYALEGTRVYVTLKRTVDGDAEFTVKNVAKYEISENADELFERFKRADASRHTEGSGLGLAISQSIVDLHGARMSIEVDGDLFKVTVKIQAI